MPPRDRRRDQPQPRREPYSSPAPSYSAPSHSGPPREAEERRPSHSDLPPEQRTWILQAKEEVERIRETLESVLRDLDEVSEQLTKAEHEKDIAETEIEQLRESLRRLHR